MAFPNRHTYAKNEATTWPIPNHWDALALIFILAIILLLGYGAKQMLGHYQLEAPPAISLAPIHLPYYALRTVIRMFIAMFFSTLFTFVFGAWAAKSKHAERIIVPLIDIAQSVPVLGFLTIAVVSLTVIFGNSLLGPEIAAIFAIFTAQVWNMTLSFYQSLKMMPKDLQEASDMFHLSAWQRFWRMEVPFAMPGLLWNAMMSMSGSWIFLVAAEAITVAHHEIHLPGIGSYIWLAIHRGNVDAIFYVIITMFIVIALYDQLLFRPLVAWAEKFKAEESASEEVAESWVLDLFQRTRLFKYTGQFFSVLGDACVNFKLFRRKPARHTFEPSRSLRVIGNIIWYGVLVTFFVIAVWIIVRFVFKSISLHEILHVVYLGFITAIRVTAIVIISSIIWVPVGVWVGLNPRASQIVQPIAQFLAAFPANLLFPIVVIAIVRFSLNVNIWVSPLMILGTQWYILFNVIAGTSALPKNLTQAVDTLNIRGWLWWKRYILPGIFPYYITGAITAAGGAWNISIIAESVSWKNIHLNATGLGAYINEMTQHGDFQRLALGIIIMSLYVVVINRIMWRPLYNLAQQRFTIR